MTPDSLGKQQTGGSSYSYMQATPASSPLPESTTLNPTQPFQDGWGIGLYELESFNFVSVTSYDGPAQRPTLALPRDPENVSPQSLGSIEQQMVKATFIKEIKALIKEQNLMGEQAKGVMSYILTGSDEGLSREFIPLAHQITDQATIATKMKMGLISTWTISSDPQEWQAKPVLAYSHEQQIAINQFYQVKLGDSTDSYIEENLKSDPPQLTPEQATALREAIASGTFDPMIGLDQHNIGSHYAAVLNRAAAEVQTKYGLPASWTPETTDLENWKPINFSALNPDAIQAARGDSLLAGVKSTVTSLNEALTKLAQSPHSELSEQAIHHSEGSTWLNFLKAVATVLREAKETLQDMQVKDALTSKEQSNAKLSQVDERAKLVLDRIANIFERIAEEAKAAKIGGIFKILGPIMTGVSAILAVATGGALACLVALVMLGISIADSFTNCTQDIIKPVTEAFKAVVEKLAEFVGGSDLAKGFITGVLLVVIAAVVIFAMSSMVGTAVKTAIQQAMSNAAKILDLAKGVLIGVVKEVTIQVLMTLLMSPEGLPNLFLKIYMELDPSVKQDKNKQMMIQMILMGILMVGIMGAVSVKQSGGIKNFIKELGNDIKDLPGGIASIPFKFKDFITDLLSAPNLKAYFQELKALDNFRKLDRFWKFVTPGVDVAKNVQLYIVNLKVADLIRKIGDQSAELDVMQELISMLTALLKKIGNSMAETGGNVEEIQGILKHIFKTSAESFSKIGESIIPSDHMRF